MMSGRRLSVTKKSRIVLSVAGTTALTVTVVALVLGAGGVHPGPVQIPVQIRDAYRAPSKSLLDNLEIRFAPLRDAQLATVRIAPTRAADIASAQYGHGSPTRVVFDSLGGYIDTTRILPDWVDTKSWVPKALPAYVVRIYDAHMATVDPSSNHYWNVIVNARDGKIIGATTFD
jgi:hypothetical protein